MVRGSGYDPPSTPSQGAVLANYTTQGLGRSGRSRTSGLHFRRVLFYPSKLQIEIWSLVGESNTRLLITKQKSYH
jgi:hypothetical protein